MPSSPPPAPIIVKPSPDLILDIDRWTQDVAHLGANCATYALDTPSLGRAFLGMLRQAGERPNLLKAEDILQPEKLRQMAAADGLELLPDAWLKPGDDHIVAIFGKTSFQNYGDYHYYRLDRDGTLSNKFINEKPSNRAADGRLITAENLVEVFKEGLRRISPDDRRFAFGGFFRVPPAGLSCVARPPTKAAMLETEYIMSFSQKAPAKTSTGNDLRF